MRFSSIIVGEILLEDFAMSHPKKRAQDPYQTWAKEWLSDKEDDLKSALRESVKGDRNFHEEVYDLWNNALGAWHPGATEGEDEGDKYDEALYTELESWLRSKIGTSETSKKVGGTSTRSEEMAKTVSIDNQSYVLLPLKKTAQEQEGESHAFGDQEVYEGPAEGDGFPFNASFTGDKAPPEGEVGETERKGFEEQARQGRQHMSQDAQGAPGAPPSAEDKIESPEYVIAQVLSLKASHAVVAERVKVAKGELDELLGDEMAMEMGEGRRKEKKGPPIPPGKDRGKGKGKEKAPKQIMNAITDLEEVEENLEEAMELLDTMSFVATEVVAKTARWSTRRRVEAAENVEQVKEILGDAEEAVDSAEKAILKVHPDAKPKKKKEEDTERGVKEEMKEEKGKAVTPEEIISSLNFLRKVGDGIKSATSEPMPGDEAEFTGDKQVPGVGDVGSSEVSRWKEMSTGDEGYRRKERAREPGAPMSAENRWEQMKDEQVGKYSIRLVDNQIPAKTAYVITVTDRKGGRMGRFVSTFENVAEGNMTKKHFDRFTSNAYKKAIGTELRKRGLKSVGAEMHGQWISETGYKGSKGNVLEGTRTFDPYRKRKSANLSPELRQRISARVKARAQGKTGAVETVKDKATQKAYYKEMYGDDAFAAGLVAENRKLKKAAEGRGEEDVLYAKAKRAYDLAMEEVELDLLENDEEQVLNRTEEIARMPDEEFEETRSGLAYWRKQAQVGDTLRDVEEDEGPDVAAGIEYDTLPAAAEGGETEELIIDPTEQEVRDPIEVSMHEDLVGESYHSGGFEAVRGDLEGLGRTRNDEIVSDEMKSRIRSRTGGVVPQLTKSASELEGTGDPLANLHGRFSTTAKRLHQSGVQHPNPSVRRTQ